MADLKDDNVAIEDTEPVLEPDRRGLLKKAFMTAAGVALYAAAPGAARAQAGTPPVLHQGTVNVFFSEGQVGTTTLLRSILQITGGAGCTGCGLVGFDINFLRGDAVLVDVTANLPAVQGVLVTAM